jgi:hypothetical protein
LARRRPGLGGGERTLAITFDDGTDFDWRDLPHPAHGTQRSLFNTLADFRNALAGGRAAHATTFVVVSRETREHIDRVGLADRGWWSDTWWRDAVASGHAAVASHSWDHNHDLAEHLMGRPRATGTFRSIDPIRARGGRDRARLGAPQARRAQSRRPPVRLSLRGDQRLPRARVFPVGACAHRRRAAFGDGARPMTGEADRWALPRYVCGRDWRSPEGLAALLRDASR